jgi:hypothetical protein
MGSLTKKGNIIFFTSLILGIILTGLKFIFNLDTISASYIPIYFGLGFIVAATNENFLDIYCEYEEYRKYAEKDKLESLEKLKEQHRQEIEKLIGG